MLIIQALSLALTILLMYTQVAPSPRINRAYGLVLPIRSLTIKPVAGVHEMIMYFYS